MKREKDFIVKLFELNDKLVNLVSLIKSTSLSENNTPGFPLSPQTMSEFIPYTAFTTHVNRYLN